MLAVLDSRKDILTTIPKGEHHYFHLKVKLFTNRVVLMNIINLGLSDSSSGGL